MGHVFGLSTRGSDAPFPDKYHDSDPTPWHIFNRDGTPVNRALIFAPPDPELDLASLPILDWSIDHDRMKPPTHQVIAGQRVPIKDKRRLLTPLMSQNEAQPGAGYRSLWIRSEDWLRMNGNAVRLEIK